VYGYDRRGRGESGDSGDYAIGREVEDLAALIGAARASPFVYGHSSGASLALEAAAAGLPLRALAVYEPPYGAGATPEFAAELRALAAAGRDAEAAERFLQSTGLADGALRHMQSEPYWPRMTTFARTLPYDVTLASAGIPAGLAAARLPVLALAGGVSPEWATTGAAKIAATVPGGRSHVFPDQTHAVARDVLIPVLSEFFVTAAG
jgi:Alpha/beta hydrolase family